MDALQPSGFPLAHLNFSGIGQGYSNIVFENVILSDAFGNQLPDPILYGAIASVPEPGIILLLAINTIGIIGIKKIRGKDI